MPYIISRRDPSGLPKAVQVACFAVGKVAGAPMYVRALANNVVLCVALTDDLNAWVGWVTARFEKDPERVDEAGVGMLCFAKSDDLNSCCQALGEAITSGLEMSDPSWEGRKAAQKLRGGKVY